MGLNSNDGSPAGTNGAWMQTPHVSTSSGDQRPAQDVGISGCKSLQSETDTRRPLLDDLVLFCSSPTPSLIARVYSVASSVSVRLPVEALVDLDRLYVIPAIISLLSSSEDDTRSPSYDLSDDSDDSLWCETVPDTPGDVERALRFLEWTRQSEHKCQICTAAPGDADVRMITPAGRS